MLYAKSSHFHFGKACAYVFFGINYILDFRNMLGLIKIKENGTLRYGHSRRITSELLLYFIENKPLIGTLDRVYNAIIESLAYML